MGYAMISEASDVTHSTLTLSGEAKSPTTPVALYGNLDGSARDGWTHEAKDLR